MSVYIVRRETKKGPRWYVRAEITRKSPADAPGTVNVQHATLHLGTFDTERRAKMRKEVAKDEIALGREPQRYAQEAAPVKTRTLREVGEEWIATRHDLKEVTRKPYVRMIRTWPDEIADLDVTAITHQDVQAWVTVMARRLKRGSIARELVVLKLVLDYADVPDNAARNRRVKMPTKQRRVYRLPTKAQLLEIRARLPRREALFDLLEHTGLRIHEAANLRWRDIDTARGRLLVEESKTAAGRRFVEHLPGTPPFPLKPAGVDPSRKVFEHPGPMTLTNVLRESHKRHGTFLMSAHELRHLHASRLLHEQILSPAQIAARLGHTDPGITLRTYTHVVPPD